MSAPSSITGQLLGRYRVVEKIGAGGMGVVYRAHDQQLDRDVALKVLPLGTLADKAMRARFHQEALAIAKLSHPNVAMAFDHGQEQGIDFIVMEYVAGITLDEKLARGPLSEKTVLELGIQLSSGLEAAHQESIIHRDLKPSNLRLTNDGHLKILDFGLAKLIKSAETESTVSLKRSLAFAGTLPYMAPEQLSGATEDRRIDVWATGAVLYEMATGKRAFPQKQNAELIDAIRHEDPVRPININPRISSALETVILKALDKDPEHRYQTARELCVDLTRITAGNAALGVRRRPRVSGYSSKLPVRGILVALIIVLLIVMLAAFWGYRHFSKMEPKRQQIMAVLPFDAVGQDPATSALGRGLTSTIAAKLVQASHLDGIQVVSPGDLREQGVKTADQARREFGTDLVLEGTLEKSGEMIRINCYLVDSKTHRQLAARTITVVATDSFGLQDQVVSEILALLPTQIRPEERRSLATLPDTQPAAYESYIRGRGYLLEYEQPESIDRAIAEFGRTIQIDPQYAPAYAALGQAYWIGYEQLSKGKQWFAKASSNCDKAQAINSALAEAHTCLGNIYFGSGKYEEAVKQYQVALNLDPNSDYALGQLADAYQRLAQPTAAESAYQKAISMRPNYWGVYSGLGSLYYSQARYAEAAAAFRKVTVLAPDNYRGYSNLGGMYLYLGQYEDSIAALKRSIELRPNRDAYTNLGVAYFGLRRYGDAVESIRMSLTMDDTDPLNWGNLGDALFWMSGHRNEAEAAYRKAITLLLSKLRLNARDPEALGDVAMYSAMLNDRTAAIKNLQKALDLAPGNPEVLFDAAFVHNQLGDTGDALAWLQRAVVSGFPKSQIRDNPAFDRLQNNPTFQTLVAAH